MIFKYRLMGTGWAECFFEINSQAFTFAASYVTDALKYLLETLIDINPLYMDPAYDDFSFKWNGEPNELEWNFQVLSNGKIVIKVTENDGFGEGLTSKIKTECNYDDFLSEIIREMKALLKKYGIVGYKDNWGYDFPVTELIQLNYYLKSKTSYPFTTIIEDYSELNCSDLNNDLKELI
ncbi:hypothetical protein [Bacillus salipaludis]|uniref:Uncharacterized protein n=1 Tax=Bacillus salipaludis TaxID=2547811 RepID=A0AA90TWF3_9BACI|nr:hypothetical protein [Bacillus salipaludis]MDQ6600719.1 hypothetical protein [Bacillus salipaludis]